ncbi:hypothetical protein, partial [Citrobacter sp.]|uniref:hypothetical protein n=1 Tax=Citrobacter sp. TaxID=1896336 RepID=UPI002FCB620F
MVTFLSKYSMRLGFLRVSLSFDEEPVDNTLNVCFWHVTELPRIIVDVKTGWKVLVFGGLFWGKNFTGTKKREPPGSRSHTTHNLDYMFSMIASPNSEHFSSLA